METIIIKNKTENIAKIIEESLNYLNTQREKYGIEPKSVDYEIRHIKNMMALDIIPWRIRKNLKLRNIIVELYYPQKMDNLMYGFCLREYKEKKITIVRNKRTITVIVKDEGSS